METPIIVALFTRAWIEIVSELKTYPSTAVARFTRAWIEITFVITPPA